MRVLIDPHAGPCSGVRRALSLLEQELNERDECFALGEVIHNPAELERLTQAGLRTIPQEQAESGIFDSIRGRRLLIRAHGISDVLRRKLEEEHVQIIDGTCPTVAALQSRLKKYTERGFQIVIIGKAGHPEVKGLNGACGGRAVICTNEADLSQVDPTRPTVIAAQTTIAGDHFERMVRLLQPLSKDLVVLRSICPQVSRRDENVRNFAERVTVLLLVGGKNSSNTRVLFETANAVNPRTFWIQSAGELQEEWFEEDDVAGITGSASTPRHQLEEVRDALLMISKRIPTKG